MSKTVAIVQSNYIPWKGYFDLINSVDEFIIFDDMQYTRRDWRNRNVIKTPAGLRWLTISVNTKGKFYQKIRETTISDSAWNRKHWKLIVHNYSSSRYFKDYKDIFEDLYLGCQETFLSAINYRFIIGICRVLAINAKISWSMDYHLSDGKTERLIELCKQAGATTYLSGPTARGYLDETLFERAKIELRFADYSGYPEYRQSHPPFEHGVSIIDLILNEGPNSTAYMKSF